MMLADVRLSEPPRDALSGQCRRRRLRARRVLRRRLASRDRLESPTPAARQRPGRLRRTARHHAPLLRDRLRDARSALDVALPQRRAAGPALPQRPRAPGRGRRARALARRRARDERRAAGRGQPRLEARRGGPAPRARAARQLPRRTPPVRARHAARERRDGIPQITTVGRSQSSEHGLGRRLGVRETRGLSGSLALYRFR